jgi:hypothetical protein
MGSRWSPFLVLGGSDLFEIGNGLADGTFFEEVFLVGHADQKGSGTYLT